MCATSCLDKSIQNTEMENIESERVDAIFSLKIGPETISLVSF